MTFAKRTVAALVLLVCLSGLQGCAQSEEQRAAMEQRLAGLRVETVNGLRVVCLQAPPAGCPSNTTNPVIINDIDKSTYVTIADRGATASLFRSNVTLMNRRAHLFVASYTNNRDIEILVNAEETPDINQARQKAISISTELGRMPACVLKEAKRVKLQSTSGVGLDGGGPAAGVVNLQPATIFVFEDFYGRARETRQTEEILLHDLAHLLFDNPTSGYATAAYRNAVVADGVYVSRYAAGIVAFSGTQGDREDVAESFVAYYGARFARDRVGAFFANTVNAAIPNRIAYFERFCPST
jgi:hypothetical protein